MPPPSTSPTTASPTTPNSLSRLPPLTTLLIYPATLILGSLFSVLSPTAHQASPAEAQSRPINYFARKDNIFNVYFVKIGWIWLTLAFVSLIISFPPSINRQTRQIQAFLRYVLATAAWYATTQWFFGPAIIDRSFVITGGKCEAVLRDLSRGQHEKGVLGTAGEEPLSVYFTAAACKAAGGAWRGGHDVSGHVFMLVLMTAVLAFEGLGVMAQTPTETSQAEASDADEKRGGEESSGGETRTWILRFVGVIVGLSWWMLLMTAIWFHTWLEKANGLLVALASIYAIYFLPRRVIPLKNFVGIPGA
ncbi:inositol phospholipid synthesis and fat-storage-inducing TM-domain-containing protein [Aspergillus californicus]